MFPPLRLAAFVLLLPLCAAPAQSDQEFTQQTLLVAPLHPDGPTRVARQVAAALRSRLARSANRRLLHVVGTDTIDILLENSGYRYDSALSNIETLVLARRMRADEVVLGTVTGRPGAVEVRALLAVMRDWRLRQPLPVVRATNANAAADTLARHILQARTQMTGLRRCENAARAGDLQGAARFAEDAIRLYPASTLARQCLALTLTYTGAGADSLSRVLEDLLATDSTNVVAAVMHAHAVTALLDSAKAARAWVRVIELRPDSLPIALDGVERLIRLERPALALEATRRLVAVHRNEPRVRRLAFRAYVAMTAWPQVAALGDSLDAEDPDFRADSTYAIRHIEALRIIGDTLAALSKSARSVRQHPGDALLYVQYVRLVSGEHATMLPRGLGLFPGTAELHVMAARAAITTGNRREAISSLGAAVTYDPLLTQGFLQMAELWFEEGQPDSALAAITRAPRNGTVELLRAYSIARGRQMIRAANDSTPQVWRRAVSLFALADTLDSQSDSRSLVTASALQLARSELVMATKVRACPEATRASDAVTVAGSTLERGVGEGTSATELQDAYGALRDAIDNAVRVLCPPEPGHASSRR